MRISDWSSDVCSSDLLGAGNQLTLYDLNASGQLSKRGWLDIPPAFLGVHVGDYAYTFGYGQGLDVWNIADIDAPAQSGHFDIDVFSARRAVQAGSTLLIPTETHLRSEARQVGKAGVSTCK